MQVYTAHKIGEQPKHWDYTIDKGPRTITLSKTDGEYLSGIIDSENDITVEVAGQEIVLDYYEAEQLLILLLAHYDGGLKIVETKTIREI